MTITTSEQTYAEELLAGIDVVAYKADIDPSADEDTGVIGRHTFDTFDRAGYMNFLAASEFGGPDVAPVAGMRILERLSAIDASLGWTAMVMNAHLKDLHFFPQEVAARLYVDGPPKIAGQGAPTGRAQRVDGGYQISGRWSYGSALPFADYVVGAAMVMDGDVPELMPSGQPNALLFITPIKNVTIGGNWDVLGLKATASLDYSMNNVFVPAAFAVDDFFGARMQWGGRSALLTFVGWLMWDHTVVELGIGRRILDELAEYSRKPSPKRGMLAESPVFQTEFARAEADFRSARAWVYEVWHDLQDTIDAGRSPSRAQLTNARAALLHVHDANEKNAMMAFRQAGGASLRPGSLQKVVRDSMAAGQHLLLSTASLVDCGRDYLGLADHMTWSLYNLI